MEGASAYLADYGVVGGGDGVEDPLDALEWFFIASSDAIKSLIVVLKRSIALTEKRRSGEGRC